MLDEALDEVVKARLQRARGVSFFGCGMASDESPPPQDRFAGYRFQITYIYCPMFQDESSWELSERPPVRREQYLCDIVHCPGKDGHTVVGVIENQLRRIGLNLTDIASGTGDGGGENEGMNGVHASLEEIGDGSYIRRRCLGHLAWRAADAGLDEMGKWAKEAASVCTYLHEGVTFRRLQSIACQPIATGGLALVREGSQDFLNAFRSSPPSILENRPETNANFLGSERVCLAGASRRTCQTGLWARPVRLQQLLWPIHLAEFAEPYSMNSWSELYFFSCGGKNIMLFLKARTCRNFYQSP